LLVLFYCDKLCLVDCRQKYMNTMQKKMKKATALALAVGSSLSILFSCCYGGYCCLACDSDASVVEVGGSVDSTSS
jgi:hypothetical protein